MGIYDYVLTKADGSDYALADQKGKVLVIVNTATGCGFTPQYKELEQLYQKYHDKGLEILDIPCNQFGNQAPGTEEEIHEFCTLKYNTSFEQLKKSDINGEHALALYAFLKEKAPFKGFGKGPKALMMEGVTKLTVKDPTDIRWNFTKFVIDRNGEVVVRFEPTEDMDELEKCVASLIG